jgi:hypothetical protein
MTLFNEHLQNETLLAFGSIRAASGKNVTVDDGGGEVITGGGVSDRFFFRFKDKLYFSWDFSIIGFRAGLSFSAGFYDLSGFPKALDLIFSASGFAGICILPTWIISLTIDVSPGELLAFRVTDAPDFSVNDSGFMLPISVGIRFNLDKL